jgi:eukaryotic-like serine/threonine-protein kinase
MAPERWRQIKQIFQAAFELPREERPIYVERACGGDQELRAEVESLLLSTEDEDFLSGAAAGYVPDALADEAWDRNIGHRVGDYEILRLIGEGGMGAVYLAERVGEFQRRAAVKLLRTGMDSRGIVRRFRNERQILAGLDHPNIARLLEGGTTEEGRPYFVMEYVEGQPLDGFAARHALGIEERLRLFQQVCAAVEYAHQRLVVHRDIKPGNILVAEPMDGQPPTPKLLDFGIAKLLGSDVSRETAGLTRAGMRLMTPEYASPEQVRGDPITTATDVYSLGAVLYQLLAGRTPVELPTDSAAEMERAVCEKDPRPPSQVAGPPAGRQLRGDLDTIVLKALQKDPARRYASAERFSADIERYLDGMPIQARPRTLVYRAGRFVRRNRWRVAAAAVVMVSVTGGLAVAVYQARIAQAERLRAERRFNDVRRLAHTFLFDFHDAIQNLPGSTPARHLVVEKALEYLNGLAQESAGDLSLEHELVEAYVRVGDVQGNGGYPNLGDVPGALASYRRALAIAERAVRADPRNATSQRYLARVHVSLGDMFALRGDPAGAVPHYRQAVAIFEAIAPRIAGDVAAQFDRSNAYAALADELGNPGFPNLGDARGAKDAYAKARGIDQAIVAAHPDNVRGWRAVGLMEMRIGDVERGSGDTKAGLRQYQTAVQALQTALARDPLAPNTRLLLGMAVGKVGSTFEAAGEYRTALAEYRKANEIQRGLLEADPRNAQTQSTYAFSLQDLAHLLAKTGDRAGALAAYREALVIIRRFLDADPQNPRRQARYAETLTAINELASSGSK